MSKPFDATLNDLIELAPQDWANCLAELCGIPPGPAVMLDTDLATSLQADKLFRIDGPTPSILHVELEANPRLGIPRELFRYNLLTDHQNDLPVESLLLLLRRKALASDMTGHYIRRGAHGNTIAEFRYRVEKVWERPFNFWLERGLGLAPLSLLTDEADQDTTQAMSRFENDLHRRAPDEKTARSLISSSFVLCGLRYHEARIQEMFGRFTMLLEDSTSYQMILEKGRKQGDELASQRARREVLLKLGTKRFGDPSPEVISIIQSITDLPSLDRLIEQILDARDWNELLANR